MKFSYLNSSLRGPAASTISGISLTNDNYSVVVKLLKEKFSKREAIVVTLYSQLPIAQNLFNKVRVLMKQSKTF